jgi:phosphatidylinositol alpha-1,6-mannosyltransferase
LGGIENIVFSLVSRWEPDDAVVVTRLVEGSNEFDDKLPFEVRREPVGTLLPTPDLTKRVDRIVRERSIEMVYFPTPLPLGIIGPRLSRRHRVPYAVSVMGADFTLMSGLPVTRQLNTRVLQGASAVLPLSRFLAERVRELVPRHAAIKVVPPGVDTDLFRPPEVRTMQKRILFVSRLVARKGAATLIKALPEVLRKHPDACLRFVGGGPRTYTTRLRAMTSNLGLESSVGFEGPQPWKRLPSYYADADLFAVPTFGRLGGREIEGFGMVYLEAAASRLPIVAGDTGGTSDAVLDGETGLLVDGADPQSVASALNDLLDNPERAESMGKAGRERAVKNFAWNVVANRFHSVLEAASRGGFGGVAAPGRDNLRCASKLRSPRRKRVFRVFWFRGIGGLLVLVGGVWLLQGIGIVPGSFMTGSTFWGVLGAVLLVAGILVFAIERARRSSSDRSRTQLPPD